MNNLQVFNNEEFGEIRTITVEGEIWFIATDVCRALEIKNVSDAVDRLDDDEKNTIVINEGITGNPNKAIISEAGLYGLILTSRKPEAKEFKRWIKHEVLPAIRKTGSYSIHNESNPNTPATNAFKDVRTLANEIQEEFIGVQRGIAISQALDIAEKVHNVLLQSLKSLLPPAEHDTGYLNPTRIGEKLGGVPAQVVNKMLARKGLQYKDGKDWRLTENGKFYGEEMPYTRNNHSGYQIRWNEDVLKVAKCQEE